MDKKRMKRLAVSAGAGLIFYLTLQWFHVWHLSGIGIAVGILSFTSAAALTGYLTEKRMLPGVLLRAIDRLPSVSLTPLVRHVFRFFTEYPALVIGLLTIPLWAGSAPPVDTLHPTAQAIYNAIVILGILWIVYSAISFAFIPEIVMSSMLTLVERFILLSLVLAAVRAYGPELADGIRFAKENPDASLAVVAAFVLLRVVAAISPSRGFAIARSGVETAGQAVAIGRPRKRSPEDIHRTAIHEAGHVLMFAARGELPDEFSVSVRAEISARDPYRGLVRHAQPTPDVKTEGYLHWSMLMHLAGAEAEYVALGERADGTSSDNKAWLAAATSYLSSGFGEVFYSVPEGDAQIEHNRVVLNALKSECVQKVQAFLYANRPLLGELAAVIANDKTLDRDQLAPYAARVVLP